MLKRLWLHQMSRREVKFTYQCNTMESPNVPSYLRDGPQPADDIVFLSRDVSMEIFNISRGILRNFSLWANGIHDQIMDEQEKGPELDLRHD